MNSSNKPSLPAPTMGSGNRAALAWAFAARTYTWAHTAQASGRKVSSDALLRVLCVIAQHIRLHGDPTCTLGYKTIAAEAMLKPRHTITTVEVLEEMGLIKRLRKIRNVSNIYRFCVPDVMAGKVAADGQGPVKTSAETAPEPPFDPLQYAAALMKPVRGFSIEETKAAIRWHFAHSPDDFWRAKTRSVSALEKGLSTMIDQYRNRKAPASTQRSAPRYIQQPAWTPESYACKGERIA